MSLELCKKCGRMHYTTDPCQPKPKKVNMKAAVAKVASMTTAEVLEASKKNKAAQRRAKIAGKRGNGPDRVPEGANATAIPATPLKRGPGRPSTGFDKRAYDAEYQRKRRARLRTS